MPERLLETIGLTELEERAFQALLTHPAVPLEELAQLLAISFGGAADILESLVRSGLVTRTPGTPVRYIAAPPEIALEALIRQREADLESTRALVKQLSRQFHEGLRETSDIFRMVEVITGRENIAGAFYSLQNSAATEVMGITAPPLAIQSLGEGDESELAALARGVRFRVLYDPQIMGLPGALESIIVGVRAGEEARMLPNPPIKLQIIDREVALIPMDYEHGSVDGSVLLKASPLLRALIMLFEQCWERATPLGLSDDSAQKREADTAVAKADIVSETDRRILVMLAAGRKDEVIAAQLGLGQSTVARRVAALMRRLGAQSRFQAGVLATRRGWF